MLDERGLRQYRKLLRIKGVDVSRVNRWDRAPRGANGLRSISSRSARPLRLCIAAHGSGDESRTRARTRSCCGLEAGIQPCEPMDACYERCTKAKTFLSWLNKTMKPDRALS